MCNITSSVHWNCTRFVITNHDGHLLWTAGASHQGRTCGLLLGAAWNSTTCGGNDEFRLTDEARFLKFLFVRGPWNSAEQRQGYRFHSAIVQVIWWHLDWSNLKTVYWKRPVWGPMLQGQSTDISRVELSSWCVVCERGDHSVHILSPVNFGYPHTVCSAGLQITYGVFVAWVLTKLWYFAVQSNISGEVVKVLWDDGGTMTSTWELI